MVLLAAVLAGCGGGGSDDAGSAPVDSEPTTEAPTDEGVGADAESTPTTTTSTPPTAVVDVPIDEELRDRLPLLEGGGRRVQDDPAFDERFCDGTKAPAVPKGQARATYPISPTDELVVAAYRFPTGGGASYLADYATAVRSCALEVGESASLGVPEILGSAFTLRTERGEAFIAMALYDDVLWILFQQSTAGPVEVDALTYDGFLQTVLG